MAGLVRVAVAASIVVPALVVGALSSPVSADPVPTTGDTLPMCGTLPDDDGQYCVVSITKNGAPVPPIDYGTDGVYDDPYVDLIGPGDVRFGLQKVTVSSGGTAISGDVDPSVSWTYVVNTGSIVPRELYGNIRNVTFSTSGGPSSGGYEFTLGFQPTPAAWVDPDADHDGNADCSYDGGCGDDSTAANPDWQYDGFVTGYVTDLATSGLSASEIAHRTGYVHVYNAQDAYEFYDADTNSIEVRMANPHLRADGVTPAEGYYQSFLPDTMLLHNMGVPDPTTLTTGSFVISRIGSGVAPATVTREAGGVRITITGITFSTPRYRIHPKASAPGVPRSVRVGKPSVHTARVSFRKPLADGGAPIQQYRARCRKGAGDWHKAAASGSPVVVGGLPKGPATCQVRAANRIGPGDWSPARTS